MKDYYQKRKGSFTLPEKIYRKVRSEIAAYPEFVRTLENYSTLSELNIKEKNTVDKVVAEHYVNNIKAALESIPERFREPVFEHCALGVDYLELEDRYYMSASSLKKYVQMYVFGYATITGDNIDVEMGKSSS